MISIALVPSSGDSVALGIFRHTVTHYVARSLSRPHRLYQKPFAIVPPLQQLSLGLPNQTLNHV